MRTRMTPREKQIQELIEELEALKNTDAGFAVFITTDVSNEKYNFRVSTMCSDRLLKYAGIETFNHLNDTVWK